MNTLIVYDSQYGNTEHIAQIIAETFESLGPAQAIRVDSSSTVPLEDVDLLILGSPTQSFQPTPAMQSLLKNLPPRQLRHLPIACFDTRFRGWMWKFSAASSMAKQLRAMGIELLAPPESFFVTSMKKEGPLESGEEEHAAVWARGLHWQYETQQSRVAVS
jgi:flavodoxin